MVVSFNSSLSIYFECLNYKTITFIKKMDSNSAWNDNSPNISGKITIVTEK